MSFGGPSGLSYVWQVGRSPGYKQGSFKGAYWAIDYSICGRISRLCLALVKHVYMPYDDDFKGEIYSLFLSFYFGAPPCLIPPPI